MSDADVKLEPISCPFCGCGQISRLSFHPKRGSQHMCDLCGATAWNWNRRSGTEALVRALREAREFIRVEPGNMGSEYKRRWIVKGQRLAKVIDAALKEQEAQP